MNAIESVFGCRRVLLPVIHVESEGQAVRNAGLARAAGCDGVFLINHAISSARLFAVQRVVTGEFPDWWIGVNCLDLHPSEVFAEVGPDVDGIWVDNGLVDERRADQPDADAVAAARAASGWSGLYFAGTAFKYQRPVEDLRAAARLASRYCDVVTTSGPGTGEAATVDKIGTMKQALGVHPLAIASGITPDNLDDYLPTADAFLVATGISRSFTELDPALVDEAVRRVHAYAGGSEAAGAARARGGVVGSVCFVCEWNEGRSAHLELSVRQRLREADHPVAVASAGLRQGGTINPLRRDFLHERGIPWDELVAHRADTFDPDRHDADLILVAERWMQDELRARHPQLAGRVMTVRGFAAGLGPDGDTLTAEQAHIEDAAGHSDGDKLALYGDLEELADVIAARLQTGAPHPRL